MFGDFDGDGDIEIVVATYTGSIYVYETDTLYDSSKIEWPMFQHDIYHTGNYHTKIIDIEGKFIRGDADESGVVDLSDAIFILNWLFLGKEGPECWDRADANDDGLIDISDPVAILLYLFKGQNPIPDPYTEAGTDTTADELNC